MRIVFAGTGAFGVPALRELVRRGRPPALVISQPDKPAGRNRVLTAPPLAAEARVLGLPLEQPPRINRPEAVERLRALAPDVLVVIAYGQILKRAVLELPRLGCVNVHGSLLPRHRGASPVQGAILAGDEVSGVTVMLMDEGLDSGPVLLEESTPVGPRETAGELHDRLAALGAPLLVRALEGLEAGALRPRAQDASRATACGMIRKEEGALRWTEPAAALWRRVRAFQPWPGTWADLPVRGAWLRVAIEEVEAVPLPAGAPPEARPGQVLEAAGDRIVVAAGEGALRLLRLRPAGKRPQPAAEFLRGYPLEAGSSLDRP